MGNISLYFYTITDGKKYFHSVGQTAKFTGKLNKNNIYYKKEDAVNDMGMLKEFGFAKAGYKIKKLKFTLGG
jgi:hypothetical protein